MKKLNLIKKLATDGAKLKQSIIDALPDNEPSSQVTAAAVTKLFAELNSLVQTSPVKN